MGDNGLERVEHALEVAFVHGIEVLFIPCQDTGVDMGSGPYAGAIEAAEDFLGTIDQLLEGFELGLILGVLNNFDPCARRSQFLDQLLVTGLTENQVVVPTHHLASQGRHHVVPGVEKNGDPSLAGIACLRLYIRRLHAERGSAGHARQPHASHPQEVTARSLGLFLFFLFVY